MDPIAATDPATREGRTVARTPLIAHGAVHFWQGLSLWIGLSHGRSEWHDHHALQIALALDGVCAFRTERDGAWTRFSGALVPSHRPHQFEVDGWPMVHLFVEPETTAGRLLVRRFGSDDIVSLPEPQRRQMAELLLRDGVEGRDARSLESAARAALAPLIDPVPHLRTVDPRIDRALEHIRTHLHHPITLEDVGQQVSLSPGRLRHLFVAETGTTYRAYVLWARLNRAIAVAIEGKSWTEAAHSAGFADSAHLTRTFKRMFGIVPVALARHSPGTAGMSM